MIERRFWIERVERAWERRSLVWLTGVRRAGKTTLVKALPGVEYFDCDLPRTRRLMDDPEGFLSSVDGPRIALDEVHRLADPAELLKIAADHYPSLQVIATGSSTLEATSKFRDTLTGRKTEVWLTPMMSDDLESFGGSLSRRLTRGGLPPFYLPDELPVADFQEWMDSYWARDVQELFRIERRSSFVRFVELILTNSGGVFEATAYAGPCEVSRPTIATWLSVLEATKVANVIRPFSTRRSTEIVSAPRVYGFDTGFVAEYRGWHAPTPDQLGPLWEHYVLNELNARVPHAEVRYWRTTAHKEVDFVVARRGRRPIAIECKWRAQNHGSLPGIAAFRRAYPESLAFVVAQDVDRTFVRNVSGHPVEFVSLESLVGRLLEELPETLRVGD